MKKWSLCRLCQVLTNLLSNAIKFTPDGGNICLRVEETGKEEGTADYTFWVKDTGIGIALEDQERIFRSFEQIGTNVARSEGTGLGLAISGSLVQAMGGKLCVESVPGDGSQFYFQIRFSFGSKTSKEDPILSDPADLRGKRVLLVEDNDLNAEIAAALLENQDILVERAADGKKRSNSFWPARPVPGGLDGYPDAGDGRSGSHEADPGKRAPGRGSCSDYCDDGQLLQGRSDCSGESRNDRVSLQTGRCGIFNQGIAESDGGKLIVQLFPKG